MSTPHQLRCIDCNYDLTGLQPSGKCPECGMAIQLSVEKGTKKWWQERMPFLVLSFAGAYILALLFYLLLFKFEWDMISYSWLSLGPLWEFLLASLTGFVTWPLLCRCLPRTRWFAFALSVYLAMIAMGLMFAFFVPSPWREVFFFLAWPAALAGCISACAAISKIVT
jgi:hypothetical protein